MAENRRGGFDIPKPRDVRARQGLQPAEVVTKVIEAQMTQPLRTGSPTLRSRVLDSVMTFLRSGETKRWPHSGNKRGSQRYQVVENQAELFWVEDGVRVDSFARIINISMHGVLLWSERLPKATGPISIRLVEPVASEWIQAVVARTARKHLLGLKLDETFPYDVFRSALPGFDLQTKSGPEDLDHVEGHFWRVRASSTLDDGQNLPLVPGLPPSLAVRSFSAFASSSGSRLFIPRDLESTKPALERLVMKAIVRLRIRTLAILVLATSSASARQQEPKTEPPKPDAKKAEPTKPAAKAPSSTLPVPRSSEGAWMKLHDENLQKIKGASPEVLFIGDSITQGWDGSGGYIWRRWYDPRKSVNLGIGGDRTQHVLWRLEHGEIEGVHPKAVVLMIGTNNIGSNTPEEIAEGVKAICMKLREKLPETKILLLAVFPRDPRPTAMRGEPPRP